MIEVLVISHSCFRRINRSIYNYLAKEHQLSIEIVTTKELVIGDKILPAEPTIEGEVTTHFLSLRGNNPRYYRYENIDTILEKSKPKIIHLDNDPVSLQAVILGRWTKKNGSVLTCLSCENLPFDLNSSVSRQGLKAIIPSLAKTVLMYLGRGNTTHVFTINNSGTKIFKKAGYSSVSKTPLGFFHEVFFPNPKSRSEKRKQLSIEKKFVFAYIGRITPAKGVTNLLKSLAKLKHLDSWVLILDKFEDAKTPYHQLVKELIEKLDLTNYIKFFDANHFEIADYMNAADAVIIPSISTKNWVEQYGRVAPEAMACGKIVVASDSGALPELIEDAGILVEEGNIEILSNTLENLVHNKANYCALKNKALKRSEKLNLKTQAKCMHEIFKLNLQ